MRSWNQPRLVGRPRLQLPGARQPAIPTLDALHALKPLQQPTYDDAAEVAQVVARLRTLPPLVFAG